MPKKKTSASSKPGTPKSVSSRPIRREVGSLVFFLAAIVALLGLFGVTALLIDLICGGARRLVGYGFWFLSPVFFASSVLLLFHRGRPVLLRVICLNLAPLLLSILIHLFTRGAEPTPWGFGLFKTLADTGEALTSGGLLGGFIGEIFYSLMGKVLAAIVLLLGLITTVLVFLRLSPVTLYDRFRESLRREYEPEPIAPSRRPDKSKSRLPDEALMQKRREETFEALRLSHDDGAGAPAPAATDKKSVTEIFTETRKSAAVPAFFGKSAPEPAPEPPAEAPFTPDLDALIPDGPLPPPLPVKPPEADKPLSAPLSAIPMVDTTRNPPEKAPLPPPPPLVKTISVVGGDPAYAAEPMPYQKPSAELLRTPKAGPGTQETADEMQKGAARLLETLRNFNVGATIINVVRGPSVARYELELESGTKLASLTNLAGDIALALGAYGVNISPVQNKANIVGVEVPNQLVTTVDIRSLIECPEFVRSGSPTSFVLGRDIAGQNIIADIRKLTHLLIAGTTGSGKSVCMNSLITSLLYNASPEELRFIMVDPKVIELAVYNGIPHLLTPVVTDPKKAAEALAWAVSEMEQRYVLMLGKNQRDIDSYNEAVRRDGDGTPMPRIIIIIDEMADLMMVAKKDIETSIARIAQKARACGVHLILATQRPQAQVVTGIIKSNIPSRIAFAVNSNLDSRIILDTGGAEKLIGRGDMLYLPVGAMRPTRVQGCLITTDEVNAVVEFIKSQNPTCYDEEIQKQLDAPARERVNLSAPSSPTEPDEDDPKFIEAVEFILETGQASVSSLQRRLLIGFARAGRLMDIMERRGIVGPSEGAKPRQILLSREEWEEMQSR